MHSFRFIALTCIVNVLVIVSCYFVRNTILLSAIVTFLMLILVVSSFLKRRYFYNKILHLQLAIQQVLSLREESIEIEKKYNIPVLSQTINSIFEKHKEEISVFENKVDTLRKSIEQQEQELQRVYDNAPDMYVSIDIKTGNIIKCNNQFYKKTGYSSSDTEGKSLYEFFHPECKNKLMKAFLNFKKTGKVENSELIIKKKNGEQLDVNTHATPIENKEGEIVQSRFVWYDISKRKIIESIQRRLLQIIESTTDIVSTATPDGSVMYINEAGRKVLGWEGDITQQRIANAHPKHVMERMKNEILPVAIQKGIWRGENFMLTKEGKELPVSQILMSHKSPKGELEYLSTVMRDIENQKEIEEELKKAKELAEGANRAKSEFLANMSHEIRTPMNAILGFTTILGELITDSKQQKYLNSIQSSGKSLLSLINDILDLSKVEAGKLKLEFVPVNILQVCKEIEQIFSPKVENKGLRFIIDVAAGTPSLVILDEIRLRQVLVNLVGNAVKFTADGHIKITVEVQHNEKLDICFIVEDTGIGIPNDQKSLVFEAFEQQEDQSQAQYGGTGLGLAITKRLVEAMGGTIHIEDSEPSGCKFVVSLQDVKVASAADVKLEEDINIDTIVFDEATILIADDIETNRELVKLFLAKYNFRFIEAQNGQVAIDKSLEYKPNLILMDIKMPVLNGYEATLRIKKDPKINHIPIIALTASAMKQDRELLKKICDGFLSKPVGKAELIKELTRFLSHTAEEPASLEIIIEQENSQEGVLLINRCENKEELLRELNDKESFCKELIEILDINEIENFGKEMQMLGDKYNYNPVISWGSRIKEQAAMFDLENLPITLKYYDDIVFQLEQMDH